MYFGLNSISKRAILKDWHRDKRKLECTYITEASLTEVFTLRIIIRSTH